MDKTRHDSLGLEQPAKDRTKEEHTSSCNTWSLTMSSLESSIADHLQCPRSIPARLPSPSFQPPYPSFSVRFPQDVTQLVIAIVGSQHRPSVSPTSDAVSTSRAAISSFLASPRTSIPPSFVEWASVTDNRGYYNLCALAYWDSKSSYESWASSSGFKAWWDGLDADADSEDDDHSPGWFLEILSPTTDRFETLFNTASAREGSSHLAGACMSSAVQEHGYWGSMRDRIPLSQTDELSANNLNTPLPSPSPSTSTGQRKKRITIPGQENLAIIRSGQDWSTTTPEERKLYLETMHPILQKGMDFLQNHGKEEVGCYSCRFMEVLESEKTEKRTDRTFGLAYFDELASLERWSREHETHLAIFGGFFRYAQQLGNNVTLRVFHEVMVLEEGQQFFEYVGCHEDTGMLASRARG
ncbi:hem-containing dehydratase domain containing protein [Rhypophila sp. PSN 637]